MQGFDYRKAVQSLNYFSAKEGGQINKMKAIKLLWLADRLHLRRYGRPVLNDQYWAMKFGPVQSAVRDLTQKDDLMAEEERRYRDEYLEPANYDLHSRKTVDTGVFSDSDLEAFDAVYTAYGTWDQFALAELSHRYPEWKKFEEQLEQNQGSRFAMNLEDFFKNPDDTSKDFFALDSKHLELSRDVFLEQKELCQ